MAEEESIQRQIAAMEGWAIQVKQKADSGKYKEAEELLRTINTQGRRLEWRGGKRGLKHLPELKEVEVLKERISQARAATKQAMTSIKYLERIAKKEGKKPAETAAIEKKASSYKKDAGKNIVSLIQILKLARGIADKEPWIDLVLLARLENKEFLCMLLRRDGYYKTYSNERFWGIRNKIKFGRINFMDANLKRANLGQANLWRANLRQANLVRANLLKANLGEADLWKANLWRADLEVADLWRANLVRANLEGANLKGADLEGANLVRANLWGADLEGANLVRANLWGANLGEANLKEADLRSVTNLTKKQLHSAENWEKAKNIPKKLL